MANPDTEYIVAVAYSNGDGVELFRTRGTERDIKTLLVKEAKRLSTREDSYSYRTNNIKGITELNDGSLGAYVEFSDYHIDLKAMPQTNIPEFFDYQN